MKSKPRWKRGNSKICFCWSRPLSQIANCNLSNLITGRMLVCRLFMLSRYSKNTILKQLKTLPSYILSCRSLLTRFWTSCTWQTPIVYSWDRRQVKISRCFNVNQKKEWEVWSKRRILPLLRWGTNMMHCSKNNRKLLKTVGLRFTKSNRLR